MLVANPWDHSDPVYPSTSHVFSFSWQILGALVNKNYTTSYKFFQEHQQNSRRFPVHLGVVDTVWSNLQLFGQPVGYCVKQCSRRLLRAEHNKMDSEITVQQKAFSQCANTHNTAKWPTVWWHVLSLLCTAQQLITQRCTFINIKYTF